jgi:glutathione S-transferase
MKLLTGPVSLFAKKVEIAAYEKDIPLEFESVPFSLKDRYQPKHPEVVRINPKQQVPILIDGDLELYDSTLIFEYFEDIKPEPNLWPKDIKQRAMARLLELTSDEIIVKNLIDLANLGREPSVKTSEQIIASVNLELEKLDQHLGDQEYFIEQLSYADIAIYCGLALGSLLNVRIPEKLQRLHQWRLRMKERASVKKTMEPMFAYIETERNR